jgi:hypothetical protein
MYIILRCKYKENPQNPIIGEPFFAILRLWLTRKKIHIIGAANSLKHVPFELAF